ncbi:MAG: hypothetical protein HQK49_04585 [Oligoflexia bacterium]|nr:hypothetical protein [Oligoflexia bacterium]
MEEALNGRYYLVVDQELRDLLGDIVRNHPEASKEVLKLILKMYLKLLDKSKRKGRDPLTTFQNLIETIITGRLYETTRDKMDYLDCLLEERGNLFSGSGSGGGGGGDSSVIKEIRELKSLIRELKGVSAALASGSGSTNSKDDDLSSYYPKDAIDLVEVPANPAENKTRKNFKELRKGKSNKVIKF